MSIRLQLRLGAALALATAAALIAVSPPAAARRERVSLPFHGVKANTGTLTLAREGHTLALTLSDDFKVPDAPAPHVGGRIPW